MEANGSLICYKCSFIGASEAGNAAKEAFCFYMVVLFLEQLYLVFLQFLLIQKELFKDSY